MIITHYWFCLLEKSIFTALATFGKDGKKFHLVLIAKGITTIAESNWFGSGRNINGNQRKPEPIPNPYYNISSSRFSCRQRTSSPIFNRSFIERVDEQRNLDKLFKKVRI